MPESEGFFWRRIHRKYHGQPPDRIPREELQARLEFFKQAIRDSVIESQADFERTQNPEDAVVGAVIYGSWARSTKTQEVQVHRGSDLDLYAITSQPMRKRPVKFTDRLANHQVGIYVECGSAFTYQNKREVVDALGGKHGLIGKDYILVTPFPEVEQTINSFLPRKK